MSEVASRIPLDRTNGKYKRDWHATQLEQVSKMAYCSCRKKNYVKSCGAS